MICGEWNPSKAHQPTAVYYVPRYCTVGTKTAFRIERGQGYILRPSWTCSTSIEVATQCNLLSRLYSIYYYCTSSYLTYASGTYLRTVPALYACVVVVWQRAQFLLGHMRIPATHTHTGFRGVLASQATTIATQNRRPSILFPSVPGLARGRQSRSRLRLTGRIGQR